MITRIFVYGTLHPEQHRWPAIEDFVERSEPASLDGYTLYHLPEGYPAIEPGQGEVVGALLHLQDEQADQAIAAVDQIEGYVEGAPRSLYERVVVEISGAPAYTYVFHPSRRDYLRSRGTLIESGDWLSR